MSVAASGTFTLGKDLEVFRLGYGAMRITGEGIWGPPKDHDEAIAVLRRAVELGVNFIDTADSYGPYFSEDLIREALHNGTDYGDVAIATKAGLTRSGPNVWAPVGRPEYLRQCLHMSLRRLGLEQIDLWQLHRIDAKVPRDEQFGAMQEFLDEGLVRYVGLSEVSVEDIKAAEDAGLPVVSVQNAYNLVNRQSEDVLEYCEQQNLGFIPWAPVDSGNLANPGGPLDQVAHRHPGVSTSQLALAWLLARSPVMLPIPGTSSVAHVEENLAAADVALSAEDITALTDAA